MGSLKDLINIRVGFLTVIEQMPGRSKWRGVEWKCKCDCGKETILNSGVISKQRVVSCSIGCPVRTAFNQFRKFHKKYVRAENGCWIWTAYKDKDGYGTIGVGQTVQQAHRFSFERYNGPIPDDMLVCHKCDTPSCVNPDHLFLGTQKDNHKDMCDKGRNCIGEKNSHAKLTKKDVAKIRSLHKNGNYTLQQLANEFKVRSTSIWQVVTNKTWKHVK